MSLLWAADYSKGDAVAAGFEDDDWNRDPSSLPWPVAVAAAPDGVRSLQVTMPSGGHRNEAVADERYMASGDDMWFGGSFYLPAGFDTAARAGSDYQVIEQQRQYSDDGSPVVALEVRKGALLLTGAYDATNQGSLYAYEQVLVPDLATGARHYVAYRVGPYSTTAGASTCDVVVDGTQVLTGFRLPPPTLIGGSTYRKQGWYRDPGNTYAGTIWHSDARTGTTFADVDSTPGPAAMSTTLTAIHAGSFYPAM